MNLSLNSMNQNSFRNKVHHTKAYFSLNFSTDKHSTGCGTFHWNGTSLIFPQIEKYASLFFYKHDRVLGGWNSETTKIASIHVPLWSTQQYWPMAFTLFMLPSYTKQQISCDSDLRSCSDLMICQPKWPQKYLLFDACLQQYFLRDSYLSYSKRWMLPEYCSI